MVHLGLAVKDSIDNAEYWIIIPVGIWIQVAAERVGYVNLLLVLDVEYKLLFDEALF